MRQKVIVGAAVVVLLAGAALAAVSATGQDNPHRRASAHPAASRPVRGGMLAAAASYLGASKQQLSSELRTGKTLAQVADATPGKSATGLIEALEAARKAKLARATTRLSQRVTAAVNRPGGPLAGRAASSPAGRRLQLATLFSRSDSPGVLAARYLGVSATRLKAQLQAGSTLGHLAATTEGKSRAGLVHALVTARRQKLASATAASSLAKARRAERIARLEKRMSLLLQRKFAGASSP